MIICDACVPKKIVTYLRNRGYDILYVPDIGRGISDHRIKNIGYKNDAFILTSDKRDFSDYRNALYVWHGLPAQVIEKMLRRLDVR